MANPPRYSKHHDTRFGVGVRTNGQDLSGNIDLQHIHNSEASNPSPEYTERLIKDMKNKDKRRSIAQGGAVGFFTGGLGGGGVGAGAGAITGAILGSVVPGPGTAIGAAIGAAIGGISGGLAAGGVGTGVGAAIAARTNES